MTILETNEPIIQANDLGKCYRIYEKPKDRLKQAFWKNKRQYFKEFWALRNVNLEIRRGETYGIIGRNGSGKSTLLQMICGTLTPTEGSVMASGRIAALLELGSGFNPEFTGIENVYLNASLIGLKQSEIESRLDDILSFADIGDFAHQPTKTYSSGMQVRLAFAVIAHVDADILVCDEALAVGDAVFTQRCMRFIRSYKQQGTLLFVSHDTSSVASLTENCIWLDKGITRYTGPTRQGLKQYSDYCQEASGFRVSQSTTSSVDSKLQLSTTEENLNNPIQPEVSSRHPSVTPVNSSLACVIAEEQIPNLNLSLDQAYQELDEYFDGVAKIINWELLDSDNTTTTDPQGGKIATINVKCVASEDIVSPIIGFQVVDSRGQIMFGENTYRGEIDESTSITAGEEFMAEFNIIWPWLAAGEYGVNLAISTGDHDSHVNHHWINTAFIITITASKKRIGGLFAPAFTAINLLKSTAAS